MVVVLDGRAPLVAAFMRQDLIDEYRIYVHPIQIGEGKRRLRRLDVGLLD